MSYSESTESGPYIFVDPDGRNGVGLVVIVIASTGVIYAHQCGGLRVLERMAEGFAVPLGDSKAAQPFIEFFRDEFHGNPPDLDYGSDASFGNRWSSDALNALSTIVETVAFWETHSSASEKEDHQAFLQLDLTRLSELTEAWVPVLTAYGPGVLIFDNSD